MFWLRNKKIIFLEHTLNKRVNFTVEPKTTHIIWPYLPQPYSIGPVKQSFFRIHIHSAQLISQEPTDLDLHCFKNMI